MSQTHTQTEKQSTQQQPSSSTSSTHQSSSNQPQIILQPTPVIQPSVSWSDDVVDNEFLNKKSSKICCIYEQHHNWSSDSSDDSEPEDSNKNAYERQPKIKKHRCKEKKSDPPQKK